ncbi:NAD-dependent epimerase/dehydratase family protein [Tropicimonas sediminicola]|uniref:Dihydroflavonol-4-reductase n=1 Tax=Tropicimonas sediminicola TaxID=1031541 RepID=A0A239LST7_9RHOB|nr:NAD-dependent epimerase/dehydratase family protein [Tropicimonas sediminicola]SNT33596.1 dihydroflavonol-4-reductase [Tropicimonas sediminicola]
MTESHPALVTGAAGFIGRRLVSALRGADQPVRALVRPEHEVDDLQTLGVEILRGDAADAQTMVEAAKGCGTIYHLAAARGPKKLSLHAYERLNTALLDAAASAALGAGAVLVAASTVSVLGGCPPGAPANSLPLRPNTRYGASRAACETRLAGHWGPRGLDWRIARIAERVAGPGARDWRGVVCAVRDSCYRWLPTGGAMHSCDVDDVVAGLRLCAGDRAQAGQTYVLTASEPEPMESLLQGIADMLGADFAPRRLPGGPARAYKRLGDAVFKAFRHELPYAFTARIYAWPSRYDGADTGRQLGFAPRFTVAEAVQRSVRWMQAEGLV